MVDDDCKVAVHETCFEHFDRSSLIVCLVGEVCVCRYTVVVFEVDFAGETDGDLTFELEIVKTCDLRESVAVEAVKFGCVKREACEIEHCACIENCARAVVGLLNGH